MTSFSSVVRIVVPTSSGGCSSGSGFVVNVSHIISHPGVFIVTNAHVVSSSETLVKVHPTFHPQGLDARVISICFDADLALLELCNSAREFCKNMYGPDIWSPVTFVSHPPPVGTDVVCIGHPLAIERQATATGRILTYYMTEDKHTVKQTVAMCSSVCNPGCSGGGAFTMDLPTPLCVGMNSFKLRNDTVDGMSGIRPAHTILQLLPGLLAPVAHREDNRREALSVLRSMLGKASSTVLQFLPSNVTDVSTAASRFKQAAVGGRCDGTNPRTLRSFLRRHVIDIGAGPHGTMRPGGAFVLSKALEEDPEKILEWRSGRSWTQVRHEQSAEPLSSVLPALPCPPSLVCLPIFGLKGHGTHDASLCNYYLSKQDTGRPGQSVQGGMVVTSVLKASMYEKSGGKPGEIVYKVSAGGTELDVGVDGKVLCPFTDTRITLRDVVCRQMLGTTVCFNVLTPDGDLLQRDCLVSLPTVDEIPHVHMQHRSTTQMLHDSTEQVTIGGIVLTTLRLNHTQLLGMREYEDEVERYCWKAVVAHISVSSPVYGHSAIQIGSVVTHVNDEPVVTDSFNSFCEQLQDAVSTGSLRLHTKRGSHRGIFAAAT